MSTSRILRSKTLQNLEKHCFLREITKKLFCANISATIYDRCSFYHILQILFLFLQLLKKKINGTANETSSIAGRKTRPARLLPIN